MGCIKVHKNLYVVCCFSEDEAFYWITVSVSETETPLIYLHVKHAS
jgi:hypothetical protein